MTKSEFRGGIKQQFLSEKEDAASSYQLLRNARVRNNAVEPIKLPVQDTSLPGGLIQGLYAFDDYLLAFIAGQAFTRKSSDTTWSQIIGFQMSATAARIYAERIPGSYINFQRKTADAQLSFDRPTRQSQAAVICMDGVSQPWLIFPDGSARVTQNWAQWSPENPEYVPIAKFPMMHGSKLYCVMQDSTGRWTRIVSSVSGRPADFVLLVGDDGFKAGASETDYGALALAYHVSYEEVTALKSINAAEGSFVVTTSRGSYLVTPDFNNLITGEPTYRNNPLFAVGAISPESITDLLGNSAVVSPEGIRTFNGVSQFRWEGRNDPIIRNIQRLAGDSIKTYGATVQFNNYVGFAMQTTLGPGVIWWDDTLSTFVAVDTYPGAARIIQFAVVNTTTTRELYFVTADNKLFRAFAGDYAEASLTLHDMAQGEAGGSLAIRDVTANFILTPTAGYWTAQVIADGQVITGATRELSAVNPPAARGNASSTKIVLPSYNAARSAVEIRWTGGAILSRIDVTANDMVDIELESFELPTNAQLEEKLIFIADDGQINANRTAVHNAMMNERNVVAFVGAGDHAYNSGTSAEVAANLAPYWDKITLKSNARFLAAPGNHDNDTAAGAALFDYVRAFPGRYGSVRFSYTEVFLFDTGFTTAGVQVNPDNAGIAGSIVGSTQLNWLLAALRDSTARNKVVVYHHPAYTSGSTHSPGLAAMQAPLQLIKDAGATAVVNGHSHLYERIVDTIPQFTVGTGGAPLHDVGTLAPGSQRVLKTYGYMRLRASPVRCIFEFVDVAGNVLDWFVA